MPLTLTRREDETIVVDGPAVIRILTIYGSRVKIEVEAPPTTKILRGELTPHDAHKPELGGESG